MKSTELRIGNYVTFFDHGKYNVVKVTFDYYQEWFRNGLKNQMIEPIKLTIDWFDKCLWFSKDDTKYVFVDIEYYSISESGSLYFMNKYTATDIRYVHELQNLYFALTGQELIIRL